MKKALLLLSLLSLSSLGSCVIAVGVPREEWDDCDECAVQSCEDCGADLVCEQCKAKHAKTTIKLVQ